MTFKEKKNKNSKEWYKNNTEKAKKRIKKWQKENPEKVKKYKRIWNKNNSQYFINHRKNNKEAYRKRYKNYYDNNPRYKIALLFRNRLNKCLDDGINRVNFLMMIGCEIDYLIYYIQEQFTEGMTWDNHGDWHIDHIKPCSKFDLSKKSEQLECFNYKNLQPLWAFDNLSKGNK